ncbi:cupin domain-containing protein [Aquibacillus sediminis]|uniref:cupin domain-containing protein n=1 Tax=Aquibacillus sediminis TaxID=2574734 RepID=UPI0011084D8F|nr:cupin domain-containing protein [Aquibacillus sediminis]
MYYDPNMYQQPYYAGQSMYPPPFIPRGGHDTTQQLIEELLIGLQHQASAFDSYSRLVAIAPNEEHQEELKTTLQDKQLHLQQLTEAYITLTGRQPVYQYEQRAYQTYKQGLQDVCKLEQEMNEVYQNHCMRSQYPMVRDIFLQITDKANEHMTRAEKLNQDVLELTDYGKQPFVVNIEKATKQNKNFRTALWTGDHLQVTLMSIGVGEDIGLELHSDVDQFLRIEQGKGKVQMGDQQDQLDFEKHVEDDDAIMVPAGKWHNLTNVGDVPLKLYSIYAPPEHPFGTVHETKEIAMEAEEHHDH